MSEYAILFGSPSAPCVVMHRSEGRSEWEHVVECEPGWGRLIVEALTRLGAAPAADEIAELRAANLLLAETLVTRDRELSAAKGATHV